MAEIRISKLIKKFNIGLDTLVDFLNSLGADIENANPNMKVSDEYLPEIHRRFEDDLRLKNSREIHRLHIDKEKAAPSKDINGNQMKTITICVDKVIEYETCGSRRTSNGWIYEESETISPKVWFSEPMVIDELTANKLLKFLEGFSSFEVNEDASWGGRASTKYEPNWTLQIVAVLNFAFSDIGYIFIPYDGLSPFIRAFYLEISSNGIAKFIGSAYPRRTLERLFSPESPFNDLNELKNGIALLVKTGNLIPDRWLAFLISNSQEDIAPFLDEYSISLANRKIGICQGNGDIFPSLMNVNEGIVKDFKNEKPLVSYEQACRKHLKKDIQWYQRYGADWQIESRHKNHISSDYDNYNDDYSYGQDELNSWEEGWEWNID